MTTPVFQAATPQAPAEPAAPAPDPLAPTADAPYGYKVDDDGTVRPKLTAGRRSRSAPPKKPVGVPPSLDELKAAQNGPQAQQKPKAEDIAPAAPPKPKRAAAAGARLKAAVAPPEPSGPFRKGPIAKGVDRIYRKAGRIIRIWDPVVGEAVISCTVKEDEDDTTVGEAWEELARVNPRIRAFLERVISGGAWGSLIAAHMPILLAVLMKDSVRDRLPLGGLVGAMMDRDDDGGQEQAGPFPGGLGDIMGNLGPEDMAQMLGFAQQMMGPMMAGMGRDPGAPLRDVVPGKTVEGAA